MDKSELFLEGHKELIKLVKWISTPMLYVPEWVGDTTNLSRLEAGSIIVGREPVGKGIEIVHSLPKEDTSLILKTFCESHLGLK